MAEWYSVDAFDNPDTERYVYDPDTRRYHHLVRWFHCTQGGYLDPRTHCRGQFYVLGRDADDPDVVILRCAKCRTVKRVYECILRGDPTRHKWETCEGRPVPVDPQYS